MRHTINRWGSWVLLYSAMLLACHAWSQLPDVRPLPKDLGLSQNFVTSAVQDHQGFMWFGTKDGLNRFDGYRFEVFQHDPTDSQSISSGYVKALLVDRRGRLWVGTDAGLDRFDFACGCFQRIVRTDSDEPGLGGIETLAEGPDGRMFAFGERNRLYAIDLDAEGVVDGIAAFPYPLPNERPFPGLVVDGLGRVWLNHLESLFRFHPPASQPQGAERSEGRWERIHWGMFSPEWQKAVTKPEPNQVFVGTQDTLFHLTFPATDGGIWLVTSPGFVHIATDGEKRYYPVPIRRSNGLGIMQYFGGGDAYEENGKLWLGGFEAFATYDLDAAAFERLELVGTDRRWAESLAQGKVIALGNTGILTLYKDASGLIWIGTNGYGIVTLDPRGPLFQRPPFNQRVDGGSVRTLVLDPSDRVWSYDYTNLLTATDLKSGERSPIRINAEAPGFVNNNQAFSIRGMAWDDLGRLWMASEGGLAVAEGSGESLEHLRAYPIRSGSDYWATKHAGVYNMAQGLDGNMWFATSSSLGLLDTASGSQREWPFPLGASTETVHTEFPDLIRTQDGVLWVGTKTGLLAFDPQTEQFQRYENLPGDSTSLSYNLVKCIQPDPTNPERYLWVGTGGGGLNRLDRSTGRFERWGVEDGLPDPVVYGILFDEAKRLWMSTNQGLASFEPESGTWRQFGLQDGLQDLEFNTRAFAKGQDGRLLFGGIQGFNIFEPASIVLDTFSPNVAFSALLLANKAVGATEALLRMDAPIQSASRLELGPKDKVLTLGLVSLDYRSPEANRFAYKLEGFDADWQNIGSQHSITFTNLDPGSYTLRVRGSNADGQWSQNEAALAIHVRPPWYATWWAWCFWLGTALLLVYGLYRNQLQRRLQRLETERLAELDRFKSRFFTNITHEFRTPLTVILGLARGIQGPAQTRERIERNGQQLLELINQLLDLSRLEAGIVQLDWERGRWDGFLEYLTEAHQSLAAEKQIRLAHYAETRPIEGDMDRAKLQHIVGNLIGNALKFTPEQGRVTLHSQCLEGPDGPHLMLKVSDTGPGMSEANALRVFDRFYRTEDTATKAGTGIGLALTKELVDAMGGQIQVESQLGHGSVFKVRLPLSAPPGASVREPSPKANGQADSDSPIQPAIPHPEPDGSSTGVDNPESEDLERPSVLVVEDNPDVIAYIAELLGDRFVVLKAMDGQSGLALARERVPDAVLSDVMMPVMDGFALTKALKQDRRTSHIPVVLLTARAGQEDKLTGLKAGADAYLSKPFDPEELFVRVDQLLALRRALQEAHQSAWSPKPHAPANEQTASVVEAPAHQSDTRKPEARHSDDAELSQQMPKPQEAAFLAEARNLILSNLSDDAFGPSELAEALRLSKTQAYRKIKALTDRNPTLFIRAVRLAEARRMLLETDRSISEIGYAVGFNQPAYFTRAFKAEFGAAPSSLRN